MQDENSERVSRRDAAAAEEARQQRPDEDQSTREETAGMYTKRISRVDTSAPMRANIMTTSQIKQRLRAAQVAIPDGATRSDLQALLGATVGSASFEEKI